MLRVGELLRDGVGIIFVLVGIPLTFTPMPGFLLVMVGLGLLATRYRWARNLRGVVMAKVASWKKALGGK